MPRTSPQPDRARRYADLCAAVAWNLPLIAGALLLTVTGAHPSPLGRLYGGAVMLGYYGLPLLLACSLLFVALLPWRRAATAAGAVAATVYTGYLVADAAAYRIVKFHIDSFWLEYLFTDFRGLGLHGSTIATAAAALAGLAVLQFVLFRYAPRLPRPRAFPLLLWGLLFAAFAASQAVHIVAYSRNDARITSLTPLFPYYVPFTSHRNAAKYGDLLPLEMQEAALGDMSHSTLHYPHSPLAFRDVPADSLPDVLVIMLESWRPDMMNPEVTPNIAALAARSTVFENHLSTGNQTTCGVFGFFYGLHATYWPAVKANSAAVDNPVLIDAVTDRGYDCRVLARSGFDRHKIEDTIFRGIEVVDRFPSGSVAGWDRDLTDQLKDFIRTRTAADRRWFAYAFYKGTHFSYSYPESLTYYRPTADLNVALADMDTPVEPILNDYRNAARFNDMLVGEVIAELEELGRLERTVIVVTSDHGDEINDNRANFWGHGTNFSRWQVQVPLILKLPGRAPSRVTARTSHVDVAPTLLAEVFGCTTDPAEYSNGLNLYRDDLAAPRPFVIGSYVNHAYVFGEDVFAIYPVHTRKHKFVDVNLPADRPPPAMMQRAAAEMSRFSAAPDATKDVN